MGSIINLAPPVVNGGTTHEKSRPTTEGSLLFFVAVFVHAVLGKARHRMGADNNAKFRPERQFGQDDAGRDYISGDRDTTGSAIFK